METADSQGIRSKTLFASGAAAASLGGEGLCQVFAEQACLETLRSKSDTKTGLVPYQDQRPSNAQCISVVFTVSSEQTYRYVFRVWRLPHAMQPWCAWQSLDVVMMQCVSCCLLPVPYPREG